MVLQLEDWADVVKSLYPQYDFLFLFDHPCGHDQMPDDALRVEGMNKGYGGEQNIMKYNYLTSNPLYFIQVWALLDDSRGTTANKERS
jgi:hypothetical protein